MKKFTNHIDSRPETIEANVAALEKLADCKLSRFERQDMGLIL